ncbi:MAG: type II toxin-antitoxin system RelE/ParE family toxin [Acidobacteria bacterium]|nr:type II toxin-antitoxin system RelE/ParE family toxin [Acidobacteriota bacterium]
MARLIIWSERATEDLEDIATYIARDSERYAKSVVRTILKKVHILSDHPHLGRVVPEFDNDSIRELFAYSYRIIYEVKDDEINIAAIVHGRRLLELALNP